MTWILIERSLIGREIPVARTICLLKGIRSLVERIRLPDGRDITALDTLTVSSTPS